jgi:ketosteroid isomerase-like protein
MTGTSVSQTQAIFDHHLQCFGTCNLEGIIEDYTDDSVLLTPQGAIRGREALRGFFTMAFAEFSKPGTTFAIKAAMVEGDCAFVVWDAETADNKYEDAQDTFVVRDAAIVVQTYSGKVTPKQR